ncbi:MAG: TetR/AcrR family transcriptional regulator C-terminal domain-containing protein [Lachnospiraceae bacterium]|nr:TetR/AcrR family transcriptional regulator C-terminal domain-containing protein [Lachnospiraceae bacterium]
MNGHERQREQSKQMIETALFKLMEKKEFSQITVSELALQADVARRTFYRLYESREDVLQEFFRKLCESYKSTYKPLKGYEITQVAKDYFGFWYQYREVLLRMHKSGLDEMLYYEISKASLSVVRNRVSDEAMKDSPEITYFAMYSVGGFINLLRHWIVGGMKEKPEEYAAKVSAALEKVMGR